MKAENSEMMDKQSDKIRRWIFGEGAETADLSFAEMRRIVEESFAAFDFSRRVLAIVPDATRDDLTAVLFPVAAEILAKKEVEVFDVLIAQGTHAPMSHDDKFKKIGADEISLAPIVKKIFDHEWDNPAELVQIGEIAAEAVGALSDGVFAEKIAVTVNRRVAPGVYDSILIFSATVPHEVAGFSGGAKYFFPGVSGRELTDATHWLGALARIENVIGKTDTPTRRLIDAATEFIETPIVCLNAVVSRTDENRLQTHALFVGDVQTAFRRATEISKQVHIKYVSKKCRRVVAVLDDHYDELWVGGKASYKLGGIVEENGELIIYAPHLKNVSATHGKMIERYGYAPVEAIRDLIETEPDLRANLCVAAHLAHVAYAARQNENGGTEPRFQIKLASALDAETCRRLKLGFLDYRQIDWREFENDAETLVVPRAGRDLYLLEETAAELTAD